MASDWRQQLAELLAGPYAGRGGIGALAEAVGVHPKTVQHWGTGRYSPWWRHRQAIALLWRGTVEAERQREEVKDL